MRRLAALGLSLILLIPAVAAGQQRDLHLRFRTLRTPHFRVYYHEPLGMIARRTAAVLERAHETLSQALDYHGTEVTHVLVTDVSDGANGSATSLPYNTIRLYATAPEDLSGLDDYEDWITELVTHEHTHVLHLDTISGIPALINAVFGKVYAPNNAQPRWFIEGLATLEESAHTSGGRIRSTMFDMFLRMDTLEDRLLRLDQISNIIDRHPGGNSWYLYGSRFLRYIADRFGDHVLAEMSHIYGRQAIPYGLNRVARRTTGHTFVELYDDWTRELRAHYGAQRDRVVAQGLVEGTRITFHGENARAPRYLSPTELVYHVGDGHRVAELRVIDPHTGERLRRLARVRGTAYAAPHPDGVSVYFNQYDSLRDVYSFNDLFRVDRRTGELTRLTHGVRAREPDIAPDGRRIVFTADSSATRHLMIADTADVEGTMHVLYRSRRYEQVYTPRFSPDGRTIAFSGWQAGGYRDIRLLDVATGRVTDVTHDRAIDTGPAFSPDGRWLYFSSDRTGIANIYAYKLDGGHLYQVTNVVGGAYHPAPSPDGREMVYLGFTSHGFDLWRLPVDPATFRDAPPYVDDRPAPVPQRSATLLSERYRPGPTLYPRAYLLELDQDGFGNALAITFQGSDIAGFHLYEGRIGVGFERGDVSASLSWTLQRLPAPISMSIYRAVRPQTGLFVEGEQRTWIEDSVGGVVALSYAFPGLYHYEAVRLSYELSWARKAEPFGGELDPNDPPPRLPNIGRRAVVRLSWAYSNAEETLYDISPSSGQALTATVAAADPAFGNPRREVAFSWSFTQYLENPWIQHHVLAIRYAGGMSGGDLRRAAFGVGGFPHQDILQALIDQTNMGGVALRGYAPFSRAGNQFHLLQTEYRFPVYRAMRGLGTFPLYLYKMYASVFLDYGHAFFGELDFSDFRLGIGAELFTELVVGYFATFTLRTGFAYGFNEDGGARFYVNLGVPF